MDHRDPAAHGTDASWTSQSWCRCSAPARTVGDANQRQEQATGNPAMMSLVGMPATRCRRGTRPRTRARPCSPATGWRPRTWRTARRWKSAQVTFLLISLMNSGVTALSSAVKAAVLLRACVRRQMELRPAPRQTGAARYFRFSAALDRSISFQIAMAGGAASRGWSCRDRCPACTNEPAEHRREVAWSESRARSRSPPATAAVGTSPAPGDPPLQHIAVRRQPVLCRNSRAK